MKNRELRWYIILVSKLYDVRHWVDHEAQGKSRQYGYIAKSSSFLAQRTFNRRTTETEKEGFPGSAGYR